MALPKTEEELNEMIAKALADKVNEEVDSRSAGIRKAEAAKLQKKMEAERVNFESAAVAKFREEHGITDEHLESRPEVEKLRSTLSAKEKAEAQKDQQLTELHKKLNDQYLRSVRSAVMAKAAATPSVLKPEDVWSLVRDDISIGDGGEPVILEDGKQTKKTIEEHIEGMIQKKGYGLHKGPRESGGEGGPVIVKGESREGRSASSFRNPQADREFAERFGRTR